MKNLYIFLWIAFFASQSHAQIIDIPDPVFKARLLAFSPAIDTNADGEIQESEAAAVTHLSFSNCTMGNLIGIQSFTHLESLNFSAYSNVTEPVDLTGMTSLKSLGFHKCWMPSVNLAGLTGLEGIGVGYTHILFLNLNQTINLKGISFFDSSVDGTLDLTHATNLTTFWADYSTISAINLYGLTQIESITCTHDDALTSLDISDQVNLKDLKLMGCSLGSIDLGHNNLLEELNVGDNEFTSLDVSNLVHLTKLECGGNQLATLDISNNPELTRFSCYGNQLTSIDFSNQHKIKSLSIGDNPFTTLDLSSFTESIPGEETPSYEIDNCPNLFSLNLKNGKLDYPDINYQQCPSLVYLCLDEVDMEQVNYVLQTNGITNVQVNTYCDFFPGGSYNTISGTVALYPEGCGNGTSYPMSGIRLNINGQNSSGSVLTDSNGHYNFYTQGGDFTVTPEMANPMFSTNPESSGVSFADNLNHTETRDFCISATQPIQNLDVSLFPTSAARPGFDANYKLVYRNIGNQVMSGSVALAYDDSVLDLTQANPAVNAQSTGNLNWDYTNLLPFESRTIDLTFNVNSPMETPPVNLGDVLHFDATVLPIISGAGNFASLNQIVSGSFDPNDKSCLEGDSVSPQKIGDYLHYLIRFQNSGTAAAQNIVVKDVIDTEKFDLSSLQMTLVSHPYVAQITGNKIEFIFENINLAAEQDNELESHGYIAFKIKTKSSLTAGASVSNTADIFFDYNFPVTTNTATTTFELLSRSQFEDTTVALYPNPVKDKLTVSAKHTITSLQLYDVTGRLIKTELQRSNIAHFDVSLNPSGIYFIKINTEKGTKIEKIIKQ